MKKVNKKDNQQIDLDTLIREINQFKYMIDMIQKAKFYKQDFRFELSKLVKPYQS